MKPVSPMPPIVAWNSSARSAAEQVAREPSASTTSSDSTELPNEPFARSFLPWMSEPIAPPTVTQRVPPPTGRIQSVPSSRA
jgi:hypothetical protein